MHYVWVHFIIHTFIGIFISDIEGIDSRHIRKKINGDNDFFFWARTIKSSSNLKEGIIL